MYTLHTFGDNHKHTRDLRHLVTADRTNQCNNKLTLHVPEMINILLLPEDHISQEHSEPSVHYVHSCSHAGTHLDTDHAAKMTGLEPTPTCFSHANPAPKVLRYFKKLLKGLH